MYNKIFAKILDSSIWLEDVNTRIVWVTFLAAMDQDGYAHFSAIANLANRARVSIADAEKAVKTLTDPDPDSADPEHDGRRIERVPGGFLILNAEKYRGIVTRIVQRERTKERVARHRAKKSNASVTQCNDSVTPSEADTYTDTITPFDLFWKNYPKKVDKKKARPAFNNLTKEKQAKATEDCGVRYKDTPKKYIPNPTTYIHGHRWDDEIIKDEPAETSIEILAKQKGLSPRPGESQEAWEQRVRGTR